MQPALTEPSLSLTRQALSAQGASRKRSTRCRSRGVPHDGRREGTTAGATAPDTSDTPGHTTVPDARGTGPGRPVRPESAPLPVLRLPAFGGLPASGTAPSGGTGDMSAARDDGLTVTRSREAEHLAGLRVFHAGHLPPPRLRRARRLVNLRLPDHRCRPRPCAPPRPPPCSPPTAPARAPPPPAGKNGRADHFRTGGVTATFTATVVLQLAAEHGLPPSDSMDAPLPGPAREATAAPVVVMSSPSG